MKCLDPICSGEVAVSDMGFTSCDRCGMSMHEFQYQRICGAMRLPPEKTIVFKHHIKKHFDEDPTLYEKDNEPGVGANVFLHWEDMCRYLDGVGGKWCWCMACVNTDDLVDSRQRTGTSMLTIKKSYPSMDGWKPYTKEEKI